MPTTVLVVDDHAFIRRGVRSILEPFAEWELCGEAENGEEAIQKVSQLHPAIVVMDVSMPVLDGIAATEAIKKKHPTTHVILLTLHNSRELLSRAFQAGARGYVLKADVDGELLKALRIVTGEGSYISPKIEESSARAVVREIASDSQTKGKRPA